MKANKKGAWAFAAAAVVTSCAWGQETEVSGRSLGPGVTLQAGLDSRIWYTDNMYWAPTDEVAAFGLLVAPALVLSYTPTAATYRLGYRGQLGRFSTSSEDDYEDSEIYLTGDLLPLLRHHVELEARYRHGHDPFGTNRTQGQINLDDRSLDIWDEYGGAVKYTFGAPEAALNVYARAGQARREYDTNRDGASGTRFFDYDAALLGGGLTYRLTAKSRLVGDLEHQSINYDVDAAPSFDGASSRALFGIRWIATAKTTGEILIGRYSRTFDAAARSDVSGLDWQGRVTWAPRLRTQLTFATGRLVRETFLLGESFINEQFGKVTWRQDWSGRLYSDVNLSYARSKFEGTAREDNNSILGATLFYRLGRSVTVKSGIEHAERDSSGRGLDFDRNVIFQGIDVVF